MPATQGVQVVRACRCPVTVGAMAAWVPFVQVSQPVAAVLTIWWGRQNSQPLAPAVLYVPGSQAVHAVCPADAVYWPASQLTQALEDLYCPAGQMISVLAAAHPRSASASATMRIFSHQLVLVPAGFRRRSPRKENHRV